MVDTDTVVEGMGALETVVMIVVVSEAVMETEMV